MRAVLILSMLFLASCTRPLTEGERAFAQGLQGDTLALEKVAIIRDAPLSVSTRERQIRPRLACRERILPEPRGDTVKVSTAAVVLWNTMVFSGLWHEEDFLKGYPEQMDLFDAMLFAHEITHVWQWQNREITGFSPTRAAREHGGGADPYLYDLTTQADWLDFGYEQQASIVEEYVCCAALDPNAPRTARLRDMLVRHMPIDRLVIPETVILPWKGAQTRGICS